MFKKNRFSNLFLVVALQFIFLQNAFAYLDPGTASYVFQALAAAIIGGLYLGKIYWQNIKQFFSKHFSKKTKNNDGK